MRTTVKLWFADKGYGFLVNGGEGSRDILVHASELRGVVELKAGQEIEFECDFNKKGLIARNVHLVQAPATTTSIRKRPQQRAAVKPLFNDHWHKPRN